MSKIMSGQEGQQPLLSISPLELERLKQISVKKASNSGEAIYQQVINTIDPYVEAFIGSDNEAYVTISSENIKRTVSLRSKHFKRFIISEYKNATGKVTRKETLDRVFDFYEAEAYENDTQYIVANRIKFLKNTIYYDLHNERCEMIEITSGGWRIITDAPVMFPKRDISIANATPLRGGNLSYLRKYINVSNENDWWLIISVILNYCYKPPYPILGIIGQQGSSKSTLAKLISELVDPSLAPINSRPRDERELFIMAKNSHLLSFDNLSGLTHQTADTFCRLVTGAGFRARELFTDASEKMIYSANPIVGNGIEEMSHRGDLISRMVQIRLPIIPAHERTTEEEFWNAFESEKPLIMGAIFDALSIALKNLPNVKLSSKPRMADFAVFACAASEALGITHDTFMNSYLDNIKDSNSSSLELDPVAIAIQDLVNRWPAERLEWIGTMSELLRKVVALIPPDRTGRAVPRVGQALSSKMKRLAPMLYSLNIGFEQLPREGGTGNRPYRLFKITPTQNICDERDNSDSDSITLGDS